MQFSDDFLYELNRRSDIESIVSNYVTLKRRGARFVGLCPFHNEKTGSFTVFPDSNSFYCFGCGAGGSPITFIRRIENLDFVEAVKLLADKCGMEMPTGGYDDSYAKLKRRIYEINRETAKFYNKYLMSPAGKPVLDYFLSRKLSMATITHFGLGASPDSWDALTKHLRSLGYRDDEMVQANVAMRSKNGGVYDRFRKRAMFPIIDLRGNVVAFGGRALPGEDNKGAKYINTSDTPVFKKSQHLYALNFAKNHCQKRIILAEGYMDVISLHQAGIENAVAALGTAFGEEHVSLLSRYTSEIVVTLDADAAGQRATDRALSILERSGLPVKVLRIPDGKDPDEFIKNNGDTASSAFSDLVDKAMNDIEYKLLKAAEGIETENEAGKLEYLKKCADILASLHDDIAVDLYVSKLCDKFGVSKTAMMSRIKQKSRNVKRDESRKTINRLIEKKYDRNDVNPERLQNLRAANAEESIISILILNPDLLNSALGEIDGELFITDFNRRVFNRVCEVIKNGHVFDVGFLGEDFTPAETGKVAEYQNRLIKGENAERELADSIKVLKEEKRNNSVSDNLSDDDWAEQMRIIAESKK